MARQETQLAYPPVKAPPYSAEIRLHIQEQARETLASMGLSVSGVVRVFLTRVAADKQLPFELKAPNATTRAAMKEAEEITRAHRARFATDLLDDLENNSIKLARSVSACSGLRQAFP